MTEVEMRQEPKGADQGARTCDAIEFISRGILWVTSNILNPFPRYELQ
jgi:hypothetical protein